MPQRRVGVAVPGKSSRAVWGRVLDVWAMTRRNLVHISREPMQLSDVTIQPVLFTVLFIFIFGGGIPIPDGGNYKDFVLAGLLALNLVTSTMGTAVGLSTDLHEGMIDRFRTLPMWRAAVLVGRSIADLMTSVLCAVIVALTGLAVGWRSDASFVSLIGGFALVLFFAYSLSWIAACVGLNSKSPESAASFGFIVLFPLAFVSNAMIPTQHMPGWLQAVANWNPVSAVTAGARHLWGNPNPSATIQAWPMQHPVEAALIWSVLILAVGRPSGIALLQATDDGVENNPPTEQMATFVADGSLIARLAPQAPAGSPKMNADSGAAFLVDGMPDRRFLTGCERLGASAVAIDESVTVRDCGVDPALGLSLAERHKGEVGPGCETGTDLGEREGRSQRSARRR